MKTVSLFPSGYVDINIYLTKNTVWKTLYHGSNDI